MKVIIAGSRTFTDRVAVFAAIDRCIPDPSIVDEVVSGCARGVDCLGEQWAKRHNIPVREFPAQWNFHGAQAGPTRNIAMARYATEFREDEDYAIMLKPAKLVLVWDGASRGSAHMLKTAKRYGMDVVESILDKSGKCPATLDTFL